MPEISVIMPVYNEKISYLQRSIDSILGQTYSDFEFIIVDDNPKSQETRDYLIKASRIDKRIKLLFNSKNEGTVISANRAILNSCGKYIARMDGDDIAYRTRLQSQLHFCRKNNIDMLCSNFSSLVNNKIHKQNVYSDTTQINQNKIRKIFSYINIAMGSSLFFNAKISNELKGYRNILCEDYDLVVRFLIHGYRVGYLATPLMYKRFRQHSLSGQNSLKEYVIIKLIGKYLRQYKYEKILPLNMIYKTVSNIKKCDIYKYHTFLLSSLRYRKNKSVINAIKRYFWACSSLLIFRRNLFILCYKFIQNILMK